MSTDIEVSQAITDPAAFLKAKITNPVLAFKTDEDVDALVSAIRQMASDQAAGIDVSTSAGRKSLVSVAAKVAKSRAFLKEVSTQAFKTLKAEADAVKIRGERALESLDELRDEIRQPVTEWEQAEEARIRIHSDSLTQIRSIATQAMTRYSTIEELDAAFQQLNALVGRNWDEFSEQADELVTQATVALAGARDLLAQRVKEKAEREETARRLAEEQAAKAEAERKLAEAQKVAAESQRNAEALQEVEELYKIMGSAADLSIAELRNDVNRLIDSSPTGIQVLDRARAATLGTLQSVLAMKEREAARKAPMPGRTGFPWEQGDTIVQPEMMPEPPPAPVVEEVAKAPIPVKLSDRDIVLGLISAADDFLADMRDKFDIDDRESVQILREAIESAEQRFKA